MIVGTIEIRVRRHLLYTYTDGNTIEAGDTMQIGSGREYRVVDIVDVDHSIQAKPLAILLKVNDRLVVHYSDIYPMLLRTRAIEPHKQPAPVLIAERAIQGDIDALFHLAFLFREGDGLTQDVDKARDLFRKAAELGHAPAACEYADLLPEIEENFSERHKWYEISARFGHVYAMRRLKKIYMCGQGVEKNEAMAEYWATHAEAFHEVGGDWESLQLTRISAIRQASIPGDFKSWYEWGMTIVNSKQNFRNILVAVEFLEMSAACGFALAQFQLAKIYLEGKLMRKNFDAALKFLRAASAQNESKALCRLAIINLQYEGSDFSISNGLKLLEKASCNGDFFGQDLLRRFSEGNDGQALTKEAKIVYNDFLLKRRALFDYAVGLEKNIQLRHQRFEFYKNAADMGLGDAQYKIAEMSALGDGIQQDWAQAEKYYRLAFNNSECNNQIQAGYILARIHELGLAGSPKIDFALHCYGVTAYRGHAESSYRIATIMKGFYDKGEQELLGNKLHYRKYLSDAANLGHEMAKLELEELPELASSFSSTNQYSEFGYLRALYDEFISYSGERVWEDVFLPQWASLTQTRKYYESIKNRDCGRKPWPDLFGSESYDLYCLSRLSDKMLLGLQSENLDGNLPVISLKNYMSFFNHIGFDVVEPTEFHPFNCEIVEVVESEDLTISIVEQIWPAIMLGNMMFARAGVKVRSPRHLFAKGVADRSILFWSYHRKNRRCMDMSIGWGHNSQWSTNFRRDFDLGDRYVYNVDESRSLNLKTVIEDDDALNIMPLTDRIDFLRYRCFTKMIHASYVGDFNWPYSTYSDYFEEVKERI